jgi:hypothetical protein
MEKGVYVIDNTKGDEPFVLLHDGFDFSREFSFECKMRKTKGDNDSVWYGLVWGYQTDGDFCDFLVGADGTYSLNIKDAAKYNEIVKWAQSPALERNDEFNVLRIERRAATLNFMGRKMKNLDQFDYHFFINGQLVQTYDNWPTVYGTLLAFRMSDGVKVEVDYIKVTVP